MWRGSLAAAVRPNRRRGPGVTQPQGPSVEIRHDTDSLSLRHAAGNVTDLGEYRQRRAFHAALDWLDARGLCACWVMPRPHKGTS
jgi:hypothetical protein